MADIVITELVRRRHNTQALAASRRREARDALAAGLVLDMLEQMPADGLNDSPAPGGLDEDQVRAIARLEAAAAARLAVRDLSTMSSDVVERDEHGRATVVQRVSKRGRPQRFRVVRDGAGRLAGLERETS